MKINLIKFSFLLIFFFSCKDETDFLITDETISLSENIGNFVDEFYIDNLRLPNSISEAKEYYSNEEQDLPFLSNLEKNQKIKYIPLNAESTEEISEYYLVYTNKNDKEISNNNSLFLKDFITLCEYENGKKGDVLLSYSSVYNILKNRVTFDLKKSQNSHWKVKILYNISFDVNPSNIIFTKNALTFTTKIDSVVIEGKFFNDTSKKSIMNAIKKGDTLNLQGLKLNNNDKPEIKLIGVTFNNTLRNSIIGKYYDEKSQLQNFPHMRGCE